MDEAQRDEIMIRLDENVKEIKNTQAVHSKHLAMINGSIQSHSDILCCLKTTVYGKNSDKGLCGEMSNMKKCLWAILFIILAGGTISGLELSDIINWFGG